MPIYWNVYAKPQACPEEFVHSYRTRRSAMAEVRALEDQYPTDMEGIPCRYYCRKETAREARESTDYEQWAAAGADQW